MPTQATILIIDDDPDILAALRKGLEIPGVKLEILTAGNGLEGLRQAKLAQPEVVILDLQMPQFNGFAVLEEIKRDSQLRATKVLMLTALDSSKNLWEGLDRQLDDFMIKPFDLVELEARIYNLLLSDK